MSDVQPFVIWGSAGHAKVLASLIRASGGEVVALFDRQHVPVALPGVPLFVGDDGFEFWRHNRADLADIRALVAIGGARGRDRIAIQERLARAGLRVESIVHPQAFVCPTAKLGAGSQVLAHAVVAADAVVGEACIVNHRASVDHECVLGRGVHIAPGATLCGQVFAHDSVFVGAGAVVLPRCVLGENAVIGAGAVVTRDVQADSIVVGNPARPVSEQKGSIQ